MYRPYGAQSSFGEPTSGLTTDRAYILLTEDAGMWVTSGTTFVRTGRAYDEPLQPDEHVALDLAPRRSRRAGRGCRAGVAAVATGLPELNATVLAVEP